MTSNVQALKNLYVALGGDLTDTYDDIAGGVAVSDYSTIPDCINAIAELKTAQAQETEETEETEETP